MRGRVERREETVKRRGGVAHILPELKMHGVFSYPSSVFSHFCGLFQFGSLHSCGLVSYLPRAPPLSNEDAKAPLKHAGHHNRNSHHHARAGQSRHQEQSSPK